MSRIILPPMSLMTSALSAAMPRKAAPVLPTEVPANLNLGAEPLNLLERYATNTIGRDFVVGDLHGCYDLFMQLLDEIKFDKEKDRMFSVGDLGDRGPDSLKCLALIREKWFIPVAGNHEQMILDAACQPKFDWQLWIANGGAWATTITKEELLDLAAEVAELPLAIVVGDGAQRFNVIHAEYHGSDADLEGDLENIDTHSPVPMSVMWGRDLINGTVDESKHAGLSPTFVGHTPVEQVGCVGSHIYIDTGAFLAQRANASPVHGLTAVEPLTGKVYRVTPKA
jgi:serine/threonine protein phosphatase 1